MKSKAAMFTSVTSEWGTPEVFVRNFQREHKLKFFLDAAATYNNSVAPYYFDKQLDCLKQDWWANINKNPKNWIWLNPPYQRGLTTKILKKAILASHDGCNIAALLPSRTGAKWFKECVWDRAAYVYFVNGRIQFKGAPSSAPFDSVVAIYSSRELYSNKFIRDFSEPRIGHLSKRGIRL